MRNLTEEEIRTEFIRAIAYSLKRAAEYDEKELPDPCEGEGHCTYYSSYFSCPECKVANAVYDDFVRDGMNINNLPRDFFLSQVATAIRVNEGLGEHRREPLCKRIPCPFDKTKISCEECVAADTVRDVFTRLN